MDLAFQVSEASAFAILSRPDVFGRRQAITMVSTCLSYGFVGDTPFRQGEPRFGD